MLNILYLLVTLSGFTALSWEIIWQFKSGLALGISAYGTALTLIIMMGGMSLGSFLMGKALHRGLNLSALRLYGIFEIIAGLAGLLLNSSFVALEKIDTWAYTLMPTSTSLVALIGIIAIFSLPSLCIGATIPLFGLFAERLRLPVITLYAWNTLGAAASILLIAFVLMPAFGATQTIWLIATANIVIGLIANLLAQYDKTSCYSPLTSAASTRITTKDVSIVFISGFVIFALEIAWFRSLENVFPNTSDILAILLASVLIALGIAARRAVKLTTQGKSLGVQLCMGGLLILLVTPLLERTDFSFALLKHAAATHTETATSASYEWLLQPETFTVTSLALLLYFIQMLFKFFYIFLLLAPPMIFLGSAFPWIVNRYPSAHDIGKLYAINTFAAILGSVCAAWLLLPTIGFVQTTWLMGTFVILTGLAITPGIMRITFSTLGIIALSIAVFFQTGIGTTRAQGFFATDNHGEPGKVLAFFNGPQTTVAAVEYKDKSRALLINSASAAIESGSYDTSASHYMAWMGHLPMLLHPDPKNALVICLGTGQTANALRHENPQSIDIVDINPAVFKLAPYFKSNEDILHDKRVNTVVMDGRAYLRRSKKIYDVITLEPMPPNTVGVNALYSKEFYQLAHQRLTANGIIAQWLPLHVVTPFYTASIVKTFIDTFPNATLWFDNNSQTGILLGTKADTPSLASNWPGFMRVPMIRDLSPQRVQQNILFHASQLKQYANYGRLITDDNQLLTYGGALYITGQPLQENIALLKRIYESNRATPIG